MRRCVLLLLALAAVLLATPATAGAGGLPKVKHVWIVVLENENYEASFGAGSKAPYLAQELPKRGQLLTQYYATMHLSLGNYIALVSGQGANPQTQADCVFYNEFSPGTIGPDGQAMGSGCVYPPTVKTIADQLEDKGLRWKGYMEDMANSPTESKTCRHPEIGQQDHSQSAKVGDQYATRHNPFVYFHSIIDEPTCAQYDVDLNELSGDLESSAKSPAYGFITPNLCSDGHDEPCVDGRPGGLVSADAFLREWVPKITGSPAFEDGGLLIVTFDEAEAEPENGDASACCDQQPGPNTPNPGGLIPGPGGGRIGAVVISPFVKPGTVNDTPYNHYSMLRSVEDLYGLDHLGFAARMGLRPFGDDVFNRPGGDPRAARTPHARFGGLPRRCVRGRFSFRYSIGTRAIKQVVVSVDGRRVRTLRARRARVTVNARRLRPGRHTLKVQVTATSGKRGSRSARFRRCG